MIFNINPTLKHWKLMLNERVATYLENMENLKNSGNLRNCQNLKEILIFVEKSGKLRENVKCVT